MPVLKDIVGKVESLLMFVVEILKRLWEKLDLFAMFPIGTTMQDGGKRKKRYVSSICYNLSFKVKMKNILLY